MSDYKKTRIGRIPLNWEVKRIDQFAPLQRGFDLPSRQIKKGKYPVVYSNGILNFHSEFKVKGPGVVTGRSGTIGKVTYVPDDYWPHNTSLWVTDFNGNSPRYVYYFFQFLRLERFNAGTGVPTLNRNDVHSYLVPVPTPPEQRKIAQILSTWDKAIELTEKLIAAKERRKRGLMQQLLTGKTRFRDFDLPSTSKYELPEKWRKQGFSRTFTKVNLKKNQIAKKHYKDDGKYPIVDQGKEKIIAWSDAQPVREPLPVIIFGDHTREVKWIDFPFIPGADGTIALTTTQDVLIRFGYYCLSNTHIKNLGYKRHFSELKGKTFSVPPLPEQQKIAAVLQAADQEIEQLKKKVELLKQQKKGLMQKLLTGRIRVKVTEKE